MANVAGGTGRAPLAATSLRVRLTFHHVYPDPVIGMGFRLTCRAEVRNEVAENSRRCRRR